MNYRNQCFLAILKAALRGQSAPDWINLTEEDWQALIRLSLDQKVLPLFADAAFSLAGARKALEPHRSFNRRQVMVQTLKTQEFLNAYQALENAGVHVLVVKGILCRSLYPKPDLRMSSDEDLLVAPGQFGEALRVLQELGLDCATQNPQANEIPCRNPEGTLYIELHRALFPGTEDAYGDWNRYFPDVFENAVTEMLHGHAIRVPEPTEHLFYLICHALKHFLHSGFGIRQICDIVLFTNRFGPRIDWKRLDHLCGQIHARVFAAAIFRVGQQYLGFDPALACLPSEWQAVDTDPEPMLEDLLSGGIYGTASMNRLHSSNITLQAVSEDKKGKQSASSLSSSLFPPAEKLEGSYPWLKGKPWLLPAAWSHRIAKYGLETCLRRDSNALDALKIGSRRVDLLRLYGIIGAAEPNDSEE